MLTPCSHAPRRRAPVHVCAAVGHRPAQGRHDVVSAYDVELAGVDSAEDDELTVYGTDRGRVVITHDREFTSRRKRNTIGLHVRIRVEQPDAPDVIESRLGELIEALSWTESAVVEVFRTTVRHYPPRWD